MENNWLERFRAEYKPLLKDKYDEFEYGLSCPKARHIRVQSSRNIDYLSELNNICTKNMIMYIRQWKMLIR